MKKIAISFLLIAVSIILVFLLFNNIEDYISNLLIESSNNKITYSLISFLALTSDIVLPVPSSIVMYSNGFVLGLLPGMVLSFISVMIGSIGGYYLGKYTSLGLKAKEDERSAIIINKYGALAILVTRGIPILAESTSILCGYNKMPMKQYVLFNVFGYIPLSFIYAFVGSLGYDKNAFLLSFGISILISAAFWIFGKSLLFRS